jgi:hypothetical protein
MLNKNSYAIKQLKRMKVDCIEISKGCCDIFFLFGGFLQELSKYVL